MRKDLPGDQWVELLDPEDIRRKHVRKIRLAIYAGTSSGEAIELSREAILTIIIKNWSLEQPIPSTEADPVTILDSLDLATWYALQDIADEYNHLGHFGDPKDHPTDPPEPSTE
jgi:hypothetical protein